MRAEGGVNESRRRGCELLPASSLGTQPSRGWLPWKTEFTWPVGSSCTTISCTISCTFMQAIGQMKETLQLMGRLSRLYSCSD